MVQKFINNLFLILFLIILSFGKIFSNDLLEAARKDYYKSTKEEKYIEKSIKKFEKLKTNQNYKGVADTYIGSLIMLKGKYAFWPNQKLKYVEDGIKKMDEGLNADPDNIESLFIYGSTCYYLPFFLGKKQLAIDKLKKLVRVINIDSINNYDNKILKNALKFILEKIEISNSEKNKLNKILKKLP